MIEPTLAVAPTGGRVVWAGRYSRELGGSLDGWNCGRGRLCSLLNDAGELVILDPLSFPWESLRADHLDTPLIVALPDDLNASQISMVLGQSLLSHLTPFDRLIERRDDVRRKLTQRWGLDADVWIGAPDASLDGILVVLAERSAGRLVEVATEFGVFRGQHDDVVTRHLEEFGAHQRGTLNVLLALLRPDDVVVDVGAHIGTFAIPLARRVSDGGHVVAIEGDPTTARLLTSNVEVNGLTDRITVLETVVGNPVPASVQSSHVAGNTGGTSFVTAPWSAQVETGSLPLDSLVASAPEIERVTVLKLDVEGAELAVLQGAAGLLARARPLIVCEVNQRQLERQYASLGELDRWFVTNHYKLALIGGRRNLAEPTWVLSPLDDLSGCTEQHFDVLAFPADSEWVTTLGWAGAV